MSAYAIFIKEQTLDPVELSIYQGLTQKAAEGHSAELIAAYGTLEVLEGGKAEGVVIVKFPSIKHANDWYYSPLYQKAAQHRMKGARWTVVFVEGL